VHRHTRGDANGECTDESSAFVRKLLEEQDGHVLREGIRVLSRALKESAIPGLIGAERSGEQRPTAIVPGRGPRTCAQARSRWRSESAPGLRSTDPLQSRTGVLFAKVPYCAVSRPRSQPTRGS
jgi:hypothetical protein